jgi:hypothetical protein
MKSTEINDIKDLKAEIVRLRLIEVGQRAVLHQRLQSPTAIYSSIMTLFSKKPVKAGNQASSFLHSDIMRLISRVVIPFTLNKTLFRHSNFLVKTLVSLVSKKAAGYVSEPAAQRILTKFKTMFKSFTTKKKKRPSGIRVLSQTLPVSLS